MRFERTEDAYPNGFEYVELAQHPAVVVVPYTKSVMSFFELYRMNVPLFALTLTLTPTLTLTTDPTLPLTPGAALRALRRTTRQMGDEAHRHGATLNPDPNPNPNPNLTPTLSLPLNLTLNLTPTPNPNPNQGGADLLERRTEAHRLP